MRLDPAQQRISSEAPCPLVEDERLLLCRSCVSLLSLLCAKVSHTNDCRCPENVRIVFRTAWRTPGLLYLFRLFDQGVLFSYGVALTSTANKEQNQEGEKRKHAAFVSRIPHTLKCLYKAICRFFLISHTLVHSNTFSFAVALTTAANEWQTSALFSFSF
jgi:hypothetical protein